MNKIIASHMFLDDLFHRRYALVGQVESGATQYVQSFFSDDTTEGFRPYLSITYTLPVKVNIADAWKSASSVKVNIEDSWKTVSGMKVNVGDTWKTIF